MNRLRTAASTLLAVALSATVLASADAATATTDLAKATPYSVTAHVNRTAPLKDSIVKIKGSVTPAAPGSKVTVQVKHADDTKWKTIGKAVLSQNSKYKFKDKVTTVRERKYRVVKPGDRKRAGGQATTEKVTVFAWRDLTTLNPAITTGFYEVGNVVVNGVSYPSSLSSFGSSATYSVDYNLNRKCTSIDARYGVGDASPVAGTATLALAVDGVQKYAGAFGLTQSATAVTDVSDAFRITLSGTSTGSAIGVVATPKVLCSF